MSDLDEKEKLVNYFNNLDRDQFVQHCDLFMSKAHTEQLNVQSELTKRLNNLKGEV